LKLAVFLIAVINISGCANLQDRRAKLDECYKENHCNGSSWISSALGGTKACNKCNSDYLTGDNDKENEPPK
jgi:hypothetical protein